MKQQGFTLIEVMIAMTLLSLIMAMIGGALKLASSSWDAGDKQATISAEMRLVSRFMQRQLKQMANVTRTAKDGTHEVAFLGRTDSINFVTNRPAHLGVDGLYNLSLLLNDTEQTDNYNLIVKLNVYRPDSEAFSEDDEVDPIVLLYNVNAITFAYYGAEQRSDDPDWNEGWNHVSELPKVIRISLTVKQRVWPDIVVALP